MLYNVPSRTGISIKPDTVARLNKIENIVAIKEASGSIDQVREIISLCDITVLSGDDAMALPIMELGGKGVVSVAANIVPGMIADLIRLYLEGKKGEAAGIDKKLAPLFKAMFIETNPIPVKAAMGIMKMLEPEWRLPLCPPRPETVQKLKAALKEQGLI
jgi:4-hydroxy-tetrahydrodipicolinate synthase